MLDEPSAKPAPGESEATLREQLKANPNSADLLYRLALLLRQENKPRESLDIYTKAASLQKPSPDQLRSVALDYVILNDYSSAIHWLRIAASFSPNNLDILYSLGRCYYTENQFPEAEAAFAKVLQLEPRNVRAEENLGLTYDAQNRPDKAEQALRNAVQWAEQGALADEWPALDLGIFLLDQSRAAEALPFLKKAASLAPTSELCREKLGTALVAAGSAAEGVKELEAAARLAPNNPKIHFELGRAYRNAGELEKAKTEFALSKSLYAEHSQN